MQFVKMIKMDFDVESITYTEEGAALIRIKMNEPIESNSGREDIEYLNIISKNLYGERFQTSITINKHKFLYFNDYSVLTTLFTDSYDLVKCLIPYIERFAKENKIPTIFMPTDTWDMEEVNDIIQLLNNGVNDGILNFKLDERVHVKWNYDSKKKKIYLESKSFSESYDLTLASDYSELYFKLTKVLVKYNSRWNKQSIGNFDWE